MCQVNLILRNTGQFNMLALITLRKLSNEPMFTFLSSRPGDSHFHFASNGFDPRKLGGQVQNRGAGLDGIESGVNSCPALVNTTPIFLRYTYPLTLNCVIPSSTVPQPALAILCSETLCPLDKNSYPLVQQSFTSHPVGRWLLSPVIPR